MAGFSIPAGFSISDIEEFGKKNKNWDIPLREVYGCLNPSIFGSGRSDSYIKPLSYKELEKYVAACKQNDVEFNYALNFSCDSNIEFRPHGKRKVIRFLQKINSLGVQRFTVVLPSMMDLLNEYVPEAKVSVSVIADVDSLMKLNTFLAPKSVDRVIVPEFLNRKIAQLERLIANGKKANCKFGTIVNSTCLIDCPFRPFHYAFSSHKSGGKNYHPVDYWATRCTLTKLNDPVEVLKMGWIRPEDINRYIEMGIDLFKIAGREMKTAHFIKAIDIYNQRSFDGNLWELLKCFYDPTDGKGDLVYSRMFDMPNKALAPFTQRFFDVKAFCTTKNCDICNYCKNNAHLISLQRADDWKKKIEKEHTSFIKDETKFSFIRAAKSFLP